jgi:hypothetical protein
MWNLDDDVVFISNFDVFVLKTIINAVWNTRIFFIFSLIQVVFAKSFEDFRTRFFLRCWSYQCESLYFWKSARSKMYFRFWEVHLIISMNENKKNYSFEKKNYFLCLMICFFEKKIHFFVLHRDISSRYFDCHKNVNRRLWFKFRWWCIVKRK